MKLNLVDRQFGELYVVSYAGTDKHHKTLWLCRCSCGLETTVVGANLTKGNSTKCKQCANKLGDRTRTHGLTGSRTYNIWANMVQRCTNPNAKQYGDYGGRGIDMDPAWARFDRFFEAMGECPVGMMLDRRDNNRGYWSDNCQWVTRVKQNRNKRSNRVYEGLCMAEWAEALGVKYKTIVARFNRTGTPFTKLKGEP